jgi:hypothetical protein
MARTKMIDEAIKVAGGIDEFNRKFDEYCKNDEFFHSNRSKWLNSCDGKWVVIFDSQLEICGKTWKYVMNRIKSKGLPSDEVAIHFVSSKPKMLIL